MTKKKQLKQPFWESGLNPVTMQPSIRYPNEESSGRKARCRDLIPSDSYLKLTAEERREIGTNGINEYHLTF